MLWFMCGVCRMKKKKYANLKVENYVLSGGPSEDLSLGGRL